MKNTLPTCKTYGEYIKKAVEKFDITEDMARTFFGAYTHEQWEKLFKN